MSNERTILDYLEDITGAISDIRSFIQGMSADGYSITFVLVHIIGQDKSRLAAVF